MPEHTTSKCHTRVLCEPLQHERLLQGLAATGGHVQHLTFSYVIRKVNLQTGIMQGGI